VSSNKGNGIYFVSKSKGSIKNCKILILPPLFPEYLILLTETLPAAELIYIPFFLFFFILQFFIEPFDLNQSQTP